jgi:hypothetical protein
MRQKIKVEKGAIFGMLTVLEEAPPKQYPGGQVARRLLVKCQCGKVKTVPLGSLTTGNTQSCGCVRWNPKQRKAYKLSLSGNPPEPASKTPLISA